MKRRLRDKFIKLESRNLAMVKLYCTNCGYMFNVKTLKLPDRCPYCDKTGSIKESKSAQDFIDEVSEMR